MSSMIKVPYQEMQQRAGVIRQQASLVRAEVQALETNVDSVEWMGNRARRFFDMWEEARPMMLQWADILEAFADELEQQARRMEAVDNSF
jgi:WXG100 family type VII secretion target